MLSDDDPSASDRKRKHEEEPRHTAKMMKTAEATTRKHSDLALGTMFNCFICGPHANRWKKKPLDSYPAKAWP